jgi:hypothetical protein
MPADKPTKLTPAEMIAAARHEHADSDWHDAECCLVDFLKELQPSLTAYLETVVQVAMVAEWQFTNDDIKGTKPPTVAEVLAAADSQFREGT